MFGQLSRFVRDESGIVEDIVKLGLIIIIAGGVLLLIVNAMAPIKNAICNFLNNAFGTTICTGG